MQDLSRILDISMDDKYLLDDVRQMCKCGCFGAEAKSYPKGRDGEASPGSCVRTVPSRGRVLCLSQKAAGLGDISGASFMASV